MKLKTLIKQYFCKHVWISIRDHGVIRDEEGFVVRGELHIDECYKCQLLKKIK